MSVANYMQQLGTQAKAASKVLATSPNSGQKQCSVRHGRALNACQVSPQAANEKDLSAAEENGLDEAMLDRLKGNQTKALTP